MSLRVRRLRHLALSSLSGLLGGLAACSPAPLYKPTVHTIQALPSAVIHAPANYLGRAVIWGGQVVQMTNFPDHSELQILAYPLDDSQRPRLKKTNDARFIALLPGFVDPLSYPPGALLTISGDFVGLRSLRTEPIDYALPQIRIRQMHRWTAAEMQQGHPNFGVGFGIAGGFH